MYNKSSLFNLRKHLLVLAPLDGYTDCAFREIVKKHGNPDLVFTEFVNCQGLIRATDKLVDILRYREFQRPIIAQLFGKEAKYFYKASLIVSHLGFDGIDINMGCPAKNVQSQGGGAALIKKPKLAMEIIRAVKKARKDYQEGKMGKWLSGLMPLLKKKTNKWGVKVEKRRKITVSVKTRTGYDSDNTEKWIKTLSKVEPDFITLHARTFKEGFKGVANWDAIKRAVNITKVPIIGNGDVKNYKDCQKMIKQTNCTGVMIGRAAIGRPWIFKEKLKIKDEKFIKKVALEHARLYVKFKGERRFRYEMGRHLAGYFKAFAGAKKLRGEISKVTSLKELEIILDQVK